MENLPFTHSYELNKVDRGTLTQDDAHNHATHAKHSAMQMENYSTFETVKVIYLLSAGNLWRVTDVKQETGWRASIKAQVDMGVKGLNLRARAKSVARYFSIQQPVIIHCVNNSVSHNSRTHL